MFVVNQRFRDAQERDVLMVIDFEGCWREVESQRLAVSYPAIPAAVPRSRHAVAELAADAGATVEQIDSWRSWSVIVRVE